jgi:hypothetical protein
MTIETTYEKLRGTPVRVGVWTITQLAPPERLFVLRAAPVSATFPHGYVSLLPDAPASLENDDGRLLSLGQDPRSKTMIASDGRALLWVGKGADLVQILEDVPPPHATTGAPAVAPTPTAATAATAHSADGGAGPDADPRSQIYTSPGKGGLAYVELELLGPTRELVPGQKTSVRQKYTLIRRTRSNPRREAETVFGLR